MQPITSLHLYFQRLHMPPLPSILSSLPYLPISPISPSMASSSLQPLPHSLRHRHPDHPSTTLSSSNLFLKPPPTTPTTISLSHTLSRPLHAVSPTTTTTPSTPSASSFDVLRQHLVSQNFREADEETRRLLIVLAGEAAQKRGYVFFSETQFIDSSDLKAIDSLWLKHSNNKFGYSVQRKIWRKVNRDFTRFFIKVRWMKKLDTEVEQYNYRAFPNEFLWELNEETPEGHLPLTNALRGTQLLSSIFEHPAFDEGGSESEGEEEERDFGGLLSKTPLSKKIFKSDYSF